MPLYEADRIDRTFDGPALVRSHAKLLPLPSPRIDQALEESSSHLPVCDFQYLPGKFVYYSPKASHRKLHNKDATC